MPLYKNKILLSSIVYIACLLTIASIFGMWHNLQLINKTGNYIYFILLVFLAVTFISWFYFTIFKLYRKEISEIESMEPVLVSEVIISEITPSEESSIKTFDKEAFILDILPSNKKGVSHYCEAILQNLAVKLNIVQGLFYIKEENDTFKAIARYAFYSEDLPPSFKIGENIPGQAMKDRRIVIIQNIPDQYIPVVSGLGKSKPKSLVMIPVFADNEPVGLMEIAVFKTIDPDIEPALKELSGIIGENLIKLMK